jgi:hypothetical protein
MADLGVRVAELARRAGLDPDDPESISPAQAQAWAGQSGRGLIRAAGQMGAAAHLDNGWPVTGQVPWETMTALFPDF